MIHENLSLVYEKRGELEQALEALKKAYAIFEKSDPPTPDRVIKLKNNIQRLENNLRQTRVPVKSKFMYSNS